MTSEWIQTSTSSTLSSRRSSQTRRGHQHLRYTEPSCGALVGPPLYEVGNRYARVAERENVETIDLHFFPNGAACLSLQFLADRRTTLKEFMDELVVPFFYRLAYTDLHGLAASRDILWAEYSHGEQGLREYLADVARIAAHGLGRNDPCACGSGRKYKRCHLGEVDRLRTAQAAGSSTL